MTLLFLVETEILPAKKIGCKESTPEAVFDRFLFMAETIPAETLQQMVQSYEETLRLLITKADDEERYYDFRHTPQSRYAISSLEIGRHDLFQEIRRIAVYTLHRFHPENPCQVVGQASSAPRRRGGPMGNEQAKSEPVSPQTTEQPMSDRKRKRLEFERRAQELHAQMTNAKFSPEEEAILDELGI